MSVNAADDYPFIAEQIKKFELERQAAQLRAIKECPMHLHPLIVTSVYFNVRDSQATADDFQTPHSLRQYKKWLHSVNHEQTEAYAHHAYTSPTTEARQRIENMKILIARLLLVLDSHEFKAL